jgi:hypothetical protein
MFRVLLLFSFLSLQYSSFGQISDMVFIGSASVKDGDAYTYKLQVTDSNGILKGYSVTDVMGPNKKQVDYKETRLVYTRSNAQRSDFCYIHAHLKISEKQGAAILKGHFTGYKEDGKTECASGKIMLVSAQDVLDKLLEIVKKDSIDSVAALPREKEIKHVHEEAIPASSIKKVTSGDTLEIRCSSPTVSVEVWDAKNIDGDVITLQQDNKILLDNYSLVSAHKQVIVDLGNRQTSTLMLTAITEGSEPLNTARMKITSGSDEPYYIDATNTMGKKVIFTLKRK